MEEGPPLIAAVRGLARSAWPEAVRGFLHARALEVLQLDERRVLDPDKPLIRMGLDSLLAVDLRNAILEGGVEVPVARVRTGPSLVELAQVVCVALDEAGVAPPPPAPIASAGMTGLSEDELAAADRHPITPNQRRLWVAQQLDPESTLSNILFMVRLRNELDVDALTAALGDLVARHPSLRTTISVPCGEPRALIGVAAQPTLAVLELGEPTDPALALEALARDFGARPFSLASGPLVRFGLATFASSDHVLLVALHHVVADGWSTILLTRDLAALYVARCSGEPARLPPISARYADYANRLVAAVACGELDPDTQWWIDQLKGAPPACLPIGKADMRVRSHAGDTVDIVLPATVFERVRTMAAEQGTTPFSVVLAAWAILLSRHTGQTVLPLGTADANRDRPEHRNTVGFYAQTVPLPCDLAGDPSFGELVSRLQRTVVACLAHPLLYETVARASGAGRGRGLDRLVAGSITLQEYHRSSDTRLPDGWSIELPNAEGSLSDVAKFELSLGIVPGEQGTRISLIYATDLFDRGPMERLVAQLGVLLEGAVELSSTRLSDLPIPDLLVDGDG